MLRRPILLALLAGALLAPSAHAAGPQIGAVLDLPVSDAAIAKLKATGSTTARMFMFQNANQPEQFTDTVTRLNGAGIKPVFVVVGDRANPPTTEAQVSAYSAYIARAAALFKGKVAAWEIWNEEDSNSYWAGQPANDGPTRDAANYTRLLQSAAAAVRGADSAASVVMGGLTGNDYLYLQSVYANGGKGAFDAVSTHTDTACGIASPYTFFKDPDGRLDQFSFLAYREVRKVMDAAGDTGAQLWMTEFGWSTTSATCDSGRFAGQKAGGVSEADQAKFISQALHCMTQDGLITRAILFRLPEEAGDTPDAKFGVVRTDGSTKPGYDALKSYGTQGDLLGDELCGDFGGPTIKMLELGDAKGANKLTAKYAKKLHVVLVASDPQIVGRITLLLDGKKVRNFTDKKAADYRISYDIFGASKLAKGPHKLTVTALDMGGNTTTQDFAVTKVTAKPKKKN